MNDASKQVAAQLLKMGPKIMDMIGVRAEETPDVNREEVWRRAKQEFEKTTRHQQRRQAQRIVFDRGPVCIVFVADLHCGSKGVDYARMEREFQAINETPGTYAVLVGDLVDNFIIGRLANLRMNNAKFVVDDEWALTAYALELIAPSLVGSVGGNHDEWTRKVAGIDFLQHTHAKIVPKVLYDPHALRVDIHIGSQEPVRIKLRHSWSGNSQYNPTHAIEKASKFDKGDPFDIGVGAHTHTAGVARQFVNGTDIGVAVQCNTYKRYDTYKEQRGFPNSNDMIAVPVVIHGRGDYVTHSTLARALDYMRLYWQNEMEDNHDK